MNPVIHRFESSGTSDFAILLVTVKTQRNNCVPKIHAILAIHQPLAELIDGELKRAYGRSGCDVRIVKHPENEIAVASALIKLLDEEEFFVDESVIVFLSIDDVIEIPSSVSRLLGEFHEAIVIGISWSTGRIRSFQLQIHAQEVPRSIKGLLDAIDDCVRRQLSQ